MAKYSKNEMAVINELAKGLGAEPADILACGEEEIREVFRFLRKVVVGSRMRLVDDVQVCDHSMHHRRIHPDTGEPALYCGACAAFIKDDVVVVKK